ncbi:tonB-system energizer ExbB [Agrobacterium tumefaciens]|uniref:tonB-system energizer ExbB n=1 Tax=Agrobacterium tumefaciens TaxID=358 RepID=UPI00287C4AE8|nr:tonB-system energizer ExbB [Agrobacterium tumefaciens]MDS7595830.1 tonB-system energizer ExbB [Agrobacterium tumefaciens]
MSFETSTSLAILETASRKPRIAKVAAIALLAGLHAGSVFAQATPGTSTEPAPLSETSPGTQTPSTAPVATPQAQTPAPTAQQTQPAAEANQQPVAAPAQPVSSAPAPANETAAPQLQGETTAPATATGNSTVLEPIADPVERADIPHNLSPWGMFMAADWVVKGVMIGLALASLITWTVWVAKSIELAGARVRAGKTLKVIRKAKTLVEATEAVEKRGGPAALMLRMASHEMHLSDAVVAHTDGGGIKERVSSALSRIETHAGRRMSRGTGILATIGSVAPFVGLFGTVWGIMNSFISISETQTTNLAVVAPGIAEALLATAIGLVAAIPAVVIYNVFARSITGYRHLLADAAAGVERLVSRDLDFRRIPPGSSSKPAVSLVGR